MIINARFNLLARSNNAGRSGKTFFTASLYIALIIWIRTFVSGLLSRRALPGFAHFRFRFALMARINLDSRISSSYNVNQQVIRVLYSSSSWRILPGFGYLFPVQLENKYLILIYMVLATRE